MIWRSGYSKQTKSGFATITADKKPDRIGSQPSPGNDVKSGRPGGYSLFSAGTTILTHYTSSKIIDVLAQVP
jgi:hypothetical protein